MNTDKVKAIFMDVLDVGSDTDWGTVRYQDTEGWDSVAHMAIVAEIEDQFDIMLDVDEVLDMSSFAVAVATVDKHGESPS